MKSENREISKFAKVRTGKSSGLVWKSESLEILKFAKVHTENSSRLVWLKSCQLEWRAMW